MPYEVEAFGKIIEIPDDVSHEDAYKQIMANRHKLDPDYDEFTDPANFKSQEPEALDYAKGFASGANRLVSGIGYLAEAAGAKDVGKSIREFGDRGAAYWNAQMSPGGKKAVESQVFVDDPESITGLRLGDDAGKALLMGASQSLPSMFAAALPGVAITKGIQALASLGLAGGTGATIPLLSGTAAPVGLGSQVIARVPSAIGFGAAEGVAAGSMNAAELKSSIESMDDKELSKSPVYLALRAQHGEEKARGMLAEQAAADLFGKTAVSTGTIGALTGGGALGSAYQKATSGAADGVLMTGLKGAGQEALQETPQSGGEKYIENITRKEYLDPTIDPMSGVLAEAASGGAIGAFTGGIVGAGSAVNITKQAEVKAREINDIKIKDIASAETLDEAIDAATKPNVTKEDVLRTVDPTLADIEAATGIKPSEAINLASNPPISRQNPANSSPPIDIVLPDNSSVKAQWRVVDADQLAASMKQDINQPRDRTRAASDVQIKNIANAPDYRRLSDSPVMDVGAPVVDSDGRIVAGNGRFEGLAQAYNQGTANEYLTQLREDAARKGLSIEGIAKPVLIRQLIEPVDTRKLAIASNSGGSLQYSALEQAKLDSERMKGIENLEVNDLGDIALTPRNATQLKDTLGGYTTAELGSLVDKSGRLSQEGVKRVRNAMLAKAYGSSPVLEKLIESTDSDMRNVLGALTKSAAHVISTKGDTKALLDAVDTYAQLKATGQPVDNFLAQQDAFSEGLSKEAAGILRFIEVNVRSQKKLTDFIKGNFREVDTTSADMFEGKTRPPNAKASSKDASWAIKNKATGEVLLETFDKAKVDALNTSKYEAVPIYEYLTGLNKDERIAKLEKHLKENGYDFNVKPASVRDIDALDSPKKARKELAEETAKLFKKKVVFVKADGPFRINGVMVPNIADTIFVDIRTDKPYDAIMAHELSHWMEVEKPDVYKQLVKSLRKVIKDDATGEYAKRYEIEGASRSDLTKEIIGDIMGDNFTDQTFWNKVAEANPKTFKDIAATIIKWLKGIIAKAKANGMGSAEWVTDATKARDILAKAVAQYTVDETVPTAGKGEVKFHKAFHGSPHDHDKFDSSKIGTGEGAQAYGYGHYFADSKEVAEYYKKALSTKSIMIDNNMYTTDEGGVYRDVNRKLFKPSNIGEELAIRGLLYGATRTSDLNVLAEEVESFLQTRSGISAESIDKAKNFIKSGRLQIVDAGKLYEVELAPEQEEYLLWDKPLSEQSEKVKGILSTIDFPVTSSESYKQQKEILEPLGIELFKKGVINQPRGDELYAKLSGVLGSNKEASKYLHSIGIRGIKYLDGSSRGKGEGNYNYVVFDDKDISITAKFSKAEIENTLLAQHNLTVRNLIHADRMGGLAAPSIAVTDKAHPLTGFGEITLLSTRDLVDPKNGAKIFGSDIYSPRYPSISYDFSGKPIKKLNELLADGIKNTGDSEFYNGSLSDDSLRELQHSSAAMYQFLTEQGKEPELVYIKPKELSVASLKPFVEGTLDSFDMSKNEGFRKLIKDYWAEKFDGEVLAGNELNNLASSYSREVIAHREAIRNEGKVDRQATNSKLFRQISDEGLRNNFEDYLVNLVDQVGPKERIFNGYTNAGNRRYLPHDIDTVIKILKKDLRGGENFNYGLGSIRAKYSPQFKSIEQIRKSKGLLMDSESFERVKKEVQAGLDDLNESLASYGTFSGFDNVETMLSDAAKRGISGALKDNGFENVPDSIKVDIQTFLNKLKNMPTEYFEAKILRAVGLGEFSTAIIPDDSAPQVEAILKRNGIEDIRKYKSGDNEDRVRQINKVTHVMFSRAPKLYSKLEQALESANDKVFSTGPQVKLWLQSNASKLGVKKDEIYWSGIDNWLDAQGKVNKQQVVEFVRNNGVKVEDVNLKTSPENFRSRLRERTFYEQDADGKWYVYGDKANSNDVYDTEAEAAAKVAEYNEGTSDGITKHGNSQLTLPGGENYRELVVTVPTIEPYNKNDTTHFGDTGQGKQIGWLRMDERDGGLFIQELQSQRAQQGRSKGFDAVPPAPFVSDANNKATNAYITLLMKKALIEAVSNDLDSVSWTTGDQQADRYDLSKQISEVHYSGTNLKAYDHDGNTVISQTGIREEDLPDYIGKEATEKLIAQPKNGTLRSLYSIDLKVGGEWAQSMYGNEQGLNLKGKPSLMTQAANDIFKHVGSGKVESINGQPGFRVTPEMKSKDLPLFSRAKTVMVDGIERPITNSDGKPINNPVNFWRWFGDSKTVDKQGRPKVFYHGTPDMTIDIFNPDTYFTESRDIAEIYTSTSASSIATKAKIANNPGVYAVYLKIDKPFDTRMPEVKREFNNEFYMKFGTGTPLTERGLPDWNDARDLSEWIAEENKGYDALLMDEGGLPQKDGSVKSRGVSYVPLVGGSQIKSATDNNGNYSRTNNDIRFSKADTPPEETRFRRFQRMNQDDFNRFTVIKEWLADNGVNLSDMANVYGAQERYQAKAANQLEDFREKLRNPLIEKIAKAGYTMDDIELFLKMQHAQEANAANRKLTGDPRSTANGIPDDEAADYLAEAPKDLGELANEFRNITELTKQLRLDNGILNTDITDGWESAYKYYIPLKGDADATRGVGKGLKVNFKSKRRLGHSLRDEHVIENILMDHERAILEVERNRVGKHLVMMAAEMQRPDILSIGQPEKRKVLKTDTAYTVEVNGVVQGVFKSRDEAKMFKQLYATSMPKVAPSAVVINQTQDQRVIASASPMLADNEVNVYIDGHAIRVQINDELLARAYTKMGVEQFSDIVAAGRMLNGYLSKVYTGYNPEFILQNLQRDFQSGLINLTGEQGIVMAAKAVGNYPSAFTQLLKYAASNGKVSTKWIDSYRANGGNTGAAYLSDMERLGQEVNTEYASYQGVLANIKQGDTANAARAAGRKVFNTTLKWIYNLNQAGENAMRLAAFKAMIDSGRTVNEAAKVAKNITVNFNRKGERQWTPALYLFFNPAIQGTAITAHALFKGKHKYQAWALASGMAAVGYMVAAALGGGSEDDWDEINDYTKERNLLIKSGDGYVKVPVPYGYGFFYNLGRHIAEAQRTGDWGRTPWHLATSAISEFTPFSDTVAGEANELRSDQVFMGFLPTAAKIVAQPAFNKQLFTGGELMPESPFDKSQPDRQKMFRSTKGTMYDTVAGWLDAAGLDVSPETLKYVTRTATGGAGSLVDTTISAAMLKKEGAELDTREIPFVRKAYMELTIQDKRAAYYKARNEARTAAEEFNRARRDNDVAKMKQVVDDKKELLSLDRYANKLAASIDAARDRQDAVRNDKNLSVKEKRAKLKSMEAEEAKYYDKYLDVFKTKTLTQR